MAIDRDITLKNAETFLRSGRLDAAISEYARVVEDQPSDWNSANTLGDLYIRAGEPERAVPHYRRIAEHLLAEGFYPRAAALFKKVLKIAPGDDHAQTRLAEISARQGLLADARAHYTEIAARRRQRGDLAGADEMLLRLGSLGPANHAVRLQSGQLEPALLLPFAEVELAEGRLGSAREAIRDFISSGGDPADVAELGSTLGESHPDAAAVCVEMAADAHAQAGAFSKAAGILREFAGQAPGRVSVLLRLVEVCLDGGLERELFEAQAQLADAYLLAGQAEEARSIAEDLVARDPADPTHAARLRCARAMLDADLAGPPGPTSASAPAAPARPEAEEIDLTRVLGALDSPAPAAAVPLVPPRSLDSVFEGLRNDAEPDGPGDESAEHLGLARTYLEMGMPGDAADALEVAARSPRYRFIAASMLAQIHREDGDLPKAIEWFERAAEAPAPTPDEGRTLLYDLGDVLETVGETARALAVFLELQTDDPGYRNVGERVARLSKVETEG